MFGADPLDPTQVFQQAQRDMSGQLTRLNDPRALDTAGSFIKTAGVVGLVSLGCGVGALYSFAKGRSRTALAFAAAAGLSWFLANNAAKAAVAAVK